MADTLCITDVSPRDGLQNQTAIVSTDDKIEFISLLSQAGVASIEAASFVSPRAVPMMADAAEVVAGVRDRRLPLRLSALTPNAKGLERAHACGVQEIAVVLAATETMNRKNIGMGLAEATRVSLSTIAAARAAAMTTRAYIAVAFECPYEGTTAPATVMNIAQLLAEAGADEIVVADTIGAASPAQVRDLLRALCDQHDADRLAAHFHDTRGMGLANAWAALECGLRRFDASAGGIGGCPFAPGAAGNLATEDLVLLAEQSGLLTGVDLQKLLVAVDFMGKRLGHTLGGHSARWLRARHLKPERA